MFRSAIQDDPFFNIGGPNGLTYSIIIEIPSSQAAPSSLIGVWVSTEFQGAQIDRSIDGGAGNDVLSILNPIPIPVTFVGGSGSDTLVGEQDQDNYFAIMRPNAGSLNQSVSYTGLESLLGGNRNDTFRFTFGSFLDHDIDARGGMDTLDYSAFRTPVEINLAAGTATGFAGGIRGIENVQGGLGDDLLIGDSSDNRLEGGGGNDVIFGGLGDDNLLGGPGRVVMQGGDGNDFLLGGGGPDILIGGAGNDHLTGGAGRDILIGGMGGDRLEGGADDDILIGGSTTFDANLPVLTGMRDIWGNTRLSYPQRIDFLRTVGVGGFRLDSINIVPDLAIDQLVGGAGRDWFWADSLDLLVDRSSPEWIN